MTAPAAPLYRIDQLPSATLGEIRAKEAELVSIKSWRGIAKLVASAALAIVGLIGALYNIFTTLVPWIYGVSVVAVGVGCAAFQKFWTDRRDGDKILEEWRECQADLANGTLFRRLLESGNKRELTWAQIQEAHQQFKKIASSIK
jgi:hypothetical protein